MTYANPNVLIGTELVAKNLSNNAIKLVEVDYDPENAYRQGHIQGASLIWWKRDINDPVRRDIISKDQFEELMSRNGITPQSEVVLYGDFNNWFAAFVFWIFKYYGHEKVKIMNGGRKKWELEKKQYTKDEPQIQGTKYISQPPNEGLRAYLVCLEVPTWISTSQKLRWIVDRMGKHDWQPSRKINLNSKKIVAIAIAAISVVAIGVLFENLQTQTTKENGKPSEVNSTSLLPVTTLQNDNITENIPYSIFKSKYVTTYSLPNGTGPNGIFSVMLSF